MNILKICYESPPLGGGGSKVVHGLSRQLARMGHSVTLVTMGYKGLPATEQAENFSIQRVPCIRSSRVVCHSHEMLSYLCMALPIVIKIANKKKYDIIHAHFIFPDGVLAFLVSRMTGLPYIITAHGSDVPGYNPDRFIHLHKLLYPLWKKIAGSCSQVICLSCYLESLVKKSLPTAKTTVVPNGIELNRFSPSKKKSNRILIVTRMFKRKGIQHFLNAVDGLGLNHEIHIVGDGPYLSELKHQAKSISAKIIFHGFMDNKSEKFTDLLETSKIFVLPSESENFPICLLEAMAAGMAIITTRNTGCEEVVGDTALLFSPGDVNGLRDALLKYIENPSLCSRAGKMARRRLENHFSWEIVARQYVKIYDEIKCQTK